MKFPGPYLPSKGQFGESLKDTIFVSEDEVFNMVNEGGRSIDLFKEGFDKEAMTLLYAFMGNVGVSVNQREEYVNNIYDFSRVVRKIESNDDPTAEASTYYGEGATATGVYQFTEETIARARKSVLNAAVHYGVDTNYIQGVLDEISMDPKKWENNQADFIFLGHLMSQKGSQWFLDEIGKGKNKRAGIETYYKFHHKEEGGPNPQTEERAERFFNEYWRSK